MGVQQAERRLPLHVFTASAAAYLKAVRIEVST
eukprot:SAG31_NODE_22087_length_534_cov_0.947126_1_plen_32_part_10